VRLGGSLKLYINQRKNPKKVGDTLISTHQTLVAAFYKDRLDGEWNWREEEDIDRAEEVNARWEFDYDEMGKPQHDYSHPKFLRPTNQRAFADVRFPTARER
jgi:hypothetical protein